MSEKPRSVGRESRSPAQEGSSKTLYEPLWPTETPTEASKGASARAPPQHTDPNEVSFKRKDQEATSKGSHNPGRQNIHRGLKYTSRTSQTEDSQRIIANLRQELINASKDSQETEEPRRVVPLPATSLMAERIPKRRSICQRKTPRPEEQNAVWRALDLVSSSPFSKEIEKARLPERFTAPRFETYNGRTDPVAHIGHYQQTMTVSRLNEPLMCLLFPSSLGEVAMRWFNQLGRRTIDSWDQMAQAFVARFITNSRKAREMDALLTMKLQDNETIKNYSIRYWETYNDIDGRSEEVAIKAFKLGLPVDSGLRHSLVKRQPSSLVKLMNKIDQFVRLEEDGKGATPAETNTQPKVSTPKHPAPARSNPAVKSLSGHMLCHDVILC
uniref:Retrotransposon gag domain-containing protein n=1 Tax=Fagus sylvatica TaxID=28930 RepID=A0A2N9EGY8_FAGSY